MELANKTTLFCAVFGHFLINAATAEELGYESGVADFGAMIESGFYQAAGSFDGDVPDTASGWSHLIAARHSNTSTNHQMQIAASYAVNDRIFFRKIASSGASNPTWNEFATRGSNTFSGMQTFTSDLSFLGARTIGATNRLHITGDERLYLLNQDGVFISKSWGGNGNLSVEGETTIFGNVGIGVAIPQNKLDVAGTIRAEEVIVSTGWADYVFEDDYELMPLAELETHIAEKGHLPGIPSASDVAENGLSIGETQKLMMEKIEEMTLYIINQNNIMKEKDRRIEELASRIGAIEAHVN